MATNTNLLIEDIKHRMEWVKQVLAEFCPLAEDTSKELDEIRDLAVKASTSDSSSTRLTTEQGLDQAYEQTKLLLESSAARHAPTVIQTHLGSGDGPARSAEPQERETLSIVDQLDTAAKEYSSGSAADIEKSSQELRDHAATMRVILEQAGSSKDRADYEGLFARKLIELERALSQAREQIAFFQTCGIIELAVRNPNVNSYINEWEGRAIRAEQQLAECKKDVERLDYLDANPRIILRTGKQHIRPLIDAAMLAASPKVTP